MSQLDPGQVVKSVYDATNQAIQVNVVATAASGASVVKITDGSGSGNNVTVTTGDALLVDGSSVTQPVSAVSLPLPTGASTSANQTTANTSLTTIATNTTTLATNSPTLGQKTSAGSEPVVIASDQSTLNVALTSASTITVVQPTGTNLHTVVDSSALPTGASTSANQTTINTTLSSIELNQTNGTQTTQVSNFPATQPVSGTVTVTQATGTNLHTVVDSSALPVGASTSANQTSANTSLSSILANQTNGTQHTIIDSGTVIATQPTGTNLHVVVDSGNITTTGTSTVSGTVTANQGTPNATPWNENIAQFGGTTVSLGSKVSTSSMPVVIASDNTVAISAASLPLPTGASTSALQTTGNTSLASIDTKTPALGQALAAASVPVVLTSAQLTTLTPLTSVTVTQATGTNLHTVIDSGTITANQGTANATPWNENISQINGATVQVGHGTAAGSLRVELPTDGTGVVGLNAGSNNIGSITNITGTVSLPTGAATSTNQTSVIGSSTGGTAATNSELIGGTYNSTLPTLTTGQQSAFQLDTKGRQQVIQSTPVSLTITQAAITVGTSAIRLTVSGSAPSSTRVVLVATPDTASTATFYIGSATVTNSGATRGVEIVAGQSFIANSDAGDYWIVASAASQTVTVMEQA